jgi:RNA polymerase sigma-70 factor (ECF subfamily)
MSESGDFAEFVRRIRAGDAQAAEELVRQFEPLVRREVRLHLEDSRLGRTFDSEDVCQSVLCSFFVRAAAGQFELNQPDNLPQLLVRMARNKMASAARRQSRQRRDYRRQAGGEALQAAAASSPTPSRLVAGRELLERFRELLSSEERQIADLRAAGLEWAAVAEQLGGTAQARRVQFARAAQRAGRQLGLDDAPDDEA